MKWQHLLLAFGAIFATAFPMLAQQSPASLAVLEFQKPKAGMQQQYEAGRKQKAAWHKQQNDPQPLLVWQILSGEDTGTYIVGRMGQHWADMDKPAIPDETDIAEYQKVVGNYVDSLVARYYEFLPKVSSTGDDDKGPFKFSEILSFHVRYGKTPDFRSALNQICQAAQKTKWPVHFEWYELVSGGPTGLFVLAVPHKNWAEFEDNPNVKPFREMLKEAFGQADADSIVNRIDGSVQEETSQIIQFHPELSYLPSK